MENYQMFFPCSSISGQQSSNYHPATANMADSHQASNGFNNIGDHSSTGFNLVMKKSTTENYVPKTEVRRDMINTQSSSGGGGFVGSENDDDQPKSNKKIKGEKKVKKPKFAFQTRSQVDILDDGYRWRKYGQKAVKNNKFPRSYYRCTYQGCNVKKQVQRLTKDEGIVLTTYEGMHSHLIEKPSDNFEHILSQMQIYPSI
ncbi:hypothetical protein Ddye_000014 [Dipteronia dyeriana]|uniref:WRKY domain-containing protein n=1 Tax=Dipteronia dyeriana TaxID=168575 RepID=A0AAD9XL15_9ROSI|nr:hypothetical protein Ddye_000014 [Dipteronia dyeriana]